MKRFFCILMITGLISCQHKKGNTEKQSVAGPTEVKMDETMHDFGLVKSGEIVIFDFVLTNTGNHDLNIRNTEVDCGCVQVNVVKDNIKPGEKGKIEVEFDSRGLFGKQLKTIDLDWNCKEPKQLVIFATVENDELEIKY